MVEGETGVVGVASMLNDPDPPGNIGVGWNELRLPSVRGSEFKILKFIPL